MRSPTKDNATVAGREVGKSKNGQNEFCAIVTLKVNGAR